MHRPISNMTRLLLFAVSTMALVSTTIAQENNGTLSPLAAPTDPPVETDVSCVYYTIIVDYNFY